MSSNKTQKWSSSSSLTKILTRITRTLSFTSKKSQQTLKNNNNNKKVKPIEPVIKNVNFVPQSAPVVRRQAAQPISKMLYLENTKKEGHHSPMIFRNIDLEYNLDEEEDYSRYSLRPNLSLFNISAENLNSESILRQPNWLDDVFHSTKIDDHY